MKFDEFLQRGYFTLNLCKHNIIFHLISIQSGISAAKYLLKIEAGQSSVIIFHSLAVCILSIYVYDVLSNWSLSVNILILGELPTENNKWCTSVFPWDSWSRPEWTRTTRTPVFWGYPPLPHDYPTSLKRGVWLCYLLIKTYVNCLVSL